MVGTGPAGLFSSLKLIELGLRPIVLERGKNVRDRKLDMALISKTQEVDLSQITALVKVALERILMENYIHEVRAWTC